MTYFLLILLAASFGLCLLLTPLVRAVATRVGLVDYPDKRRKIHERAIPVAGGIAVFVSGAVVLIAALCFPGPFGDEIASHGARLIAPLLGCALIFAIGVLDDACALRGRHKLVGQFLVVAIVMSANFVVRDVRILGWDLELGILAIPCTALWLLACTNSLNLLDGMDGLLGTAAGVICAAFAGIAIFQEQWPAAGVAVVLLGGLLGFLVYNFPPATIYLGDGGSMLIGLLVGILAIQCTVVPAPSAWEPAVALAVLTIPICDTLAAILRRKLTGRSIFSTDRGHLHHCLLRRGLTPRAVLGVVAGVSLAAAGGAVAALAFNCELVAVLTVPALAAFLIETRLFGHAEYMLARTHLRAAIVRIVLRRLNNRVQQMEVRLQGSIAWEELWERLVHSAADLEFVFISLDVNAPFIHEGFYARWESLAHPLSDDGGGWQAEIPLEAWGPVVGRVVLHGLQRDELFWNKIAVVACIIAEFETPGLPGTADSGRGGANKRARELVAAVKERHLGAEETAHGDGRESSEEASPAC